MLGLSGKKINESVSASLSAVVYIKSKRKSVRYLEINHEDYSMEKFHEKLINSLKNKANRLNSIVDDMKRKLK